MSHGWQSKSTEGSTSGWRQRSVVAVVIVEGSLEMKLRPGRNSDVEKVRREKMQVQEKVGKSRNTVFFQCFVAPEGRKVGSL